MTQIPESQYPKLPVPIYRVALGADKALGFLISGEIDSTVSDVIARRNDTTIEGAHLLMLQGLNPEVQRQKLWRTIERNEIASAKSKDADFLARSLAPLTSRNRLRLIKKYRLNKVLRGLTIGKALRPEGD